MDSRPSPAAAERALRSFKELVGDGRDLPLLQPALELGRIEDPDFDAQRSLAVLSTLFHAVQAADPGPEAEDEERLESMRRVLVEEEGFTGDESLAGETWTSCLHLVLERRRGLPILLSVIYLEIARRLGLPLRGVGLPGRYVVRLSGTLPPLFLDPWDSGAYLDEEGCARLVDRLTHGRVAMQPEFLRPWSHLRTLWRMLNNMKATYVAAGDLVRARQAVDRQIFLRPEVAEPWRDRGLLAYRSLLFHRAVADLEAYLERAPQAEDAEAIRDQLKSLRRLLGCPN